MKKILSIFVAGALFLTSISNNFCLAVSQNSVKEKTINSSRLNSVSKKAKNCATAVGNFLKKNGGIIVLTGTGASLLGATSFGGFNLAKNSKEVKEILLDSSKTYKEKFNSVLKIALFGKKDKVEAEQEKIEEEKAEQERLAQEKAEQERLAQEKAEQERLAQEKAEQERIEKEKADLKKRIDIDNPHEEKDQPARKIKDSTMKKGNFISRWWDSFKAKQFEQGMNDFRANKAKTQKCIEKYGNTSFYDVDSGKCKFSFNGEKAFGDFPG